MTTTEADRRVKDLLNADPWGLREHDLLIRLDLRVGSLEQGLKEHKGDHRFSLTTLVAVSALLVGSLSLIAAFVL